MKGGGGSGSAGGRMLAVFSLLALSAIALSVLGNVVGPAVPVAVSVAVGGSMFPAIGNGDMVVAVSRHLKRVEAGDVVVYRGVDGLVTHRVLSVEGDLALVAGDNNAAPDGYVPVSSVWFVVVAVLPPHVWAPLLATSVSSVGMAIYSCRRRGYRVASILLFASASAFVIALSSAVMLAPPSGLVKPSQLPVLVPDGVEGGVAVFKLNPPLPGEVVCEVGGVVVPCELSGGVVRAEVPETASCPLELAVNYRLGTPYNVSVLYRVTLGVCR